MSVGLLDDNEDGFDEPKNEGRLPLRLSVTVKLPLSITTGLLPISLTAFLRLLSNPGVSSST